jgi:ribosomal protein S6
MADLAATIRRLVEENFGEDGRILFEAKFEQDLAYEQIGKILEGRYSIVALRKKAERIKELIRSQLALGSGQPS